MPKRRPKWDFGAGATPSDAAQAIRGAKKGQHKTTFEYIDPNTKTRKQLSRHFKHVGDHLARKGILKRGGKLDSLEKRLGQKELARQMGVNERTIRKWKSGQRKMTEKSLRKLSSVLSANKRKPLKLLTASHAFTSSFYSALQWYYRKFGRQAPTPKILRIEYVRAR